MNTTTIQTLPNEILAQILQAFNQVTPHKGAKESLLVCKSWYPVAKQEFYKKVCINQSVNVTSFLYSLENYDIGHYIQVLTISAKSRHVKPPFIYRNHSSLIFSMCINLTEVRLRNVNPYFILRTIETSNLKRLEKIDICWSTCGSSPSVVRWFCRANLRHKKSIKKIKMPPLYQLNSSDEEKMFDDLLKNTERLRIYD